VRTRVDPTQCRYQAPRLMPNFGPAPAEIDELVTDILDLKEKPR
jgi:hypothetical protein